MELTWEDVPAHYTSFVIRRRPGEMSAELIRRRVFLLQRHYYLCVCVWNSHKNQKDLSRIKEYCSLGKYVTKKKNIYFPFNSGELTSNLLRQTNKTCPTKNKWRCLRLCAVGRVACAWREIWREPSAGGGAAVGAAGPHPRLWSASVRGAHPDIDTCITLLTHTHTDILIPSICKNVIVAV